jgi:hypothetical protein
MFMVDGSDGADVPMEKPKSVMMLMMMMMMKAFRLKVGYTGLSSPTMSWLL